MTCTFRIKKERGQVCHLESGLFFGIMLLLFLVYLDVVPISENIILLLMIAAIAVKIIKRWIIRIECNDYIKVLTTCFLLPFVLVLLYSLLIHFLCRHPVRYATRSISDIGRILIFLLFFESYFEIFKGRTAVHFTSVCVIAYLPAIISFIFEYGLFNGLFLLLSGDAGSLGVSLEVHGLTYVFGAQTIFYFYFWCIHKKAEYKKLFLVCLLMALLGVKRIATAAVIAILLAIIIIQLLERTRRNSIVFIGAWCMVVTAYCYILAIHSGLFEAVFNSIGVRDNTRIAMWNYFRDRYSMDPLYLGRGISFPQKIMEVEYGNVYFYTQKGNLNYLRKPLNIHNDILTFYIGLGFWGSLLYWYSFFVLRVKILWRKYSSETGIFAFMISMYYFIIFMFTNAGINELQNATCMLMIMMAIFNEKEKSQNAK